MDMITYPCVNSSQMMLVTGTHVRYVAVSFIKGYFLLTEND